MFNEVFQFLVFETGVPEGIRTPDLRIRSPFLYPAELQAHMERVKGIEPSQSAWKADVLPLNYTRTYRLTSDFHIISSAVLFVNDVICILQGRRGTFRDGRLRLQPVH